MHSRQFIISDEILERVHCLTTFGSWKSDVNSFPGLDGQIAFGPTYSFEYSTRDAYGKNISGWGRNDPLNATWWHLVTEGKSRCWCNRCCLYSHCLPSYVRGPVAGCGGYCLVSRATTDPHYSCFPAFSSKTCSKANLLLGQLRV